MTYRGYNMLDQTTKGLPYGSRLWRTEVASKHWNVLRGNLPFPLLVLKESALEHNLRAMAEWCSSRGLLLAPHGKTTMCPQIFERQLAHGAWAITVANVAQAQVCLSFGIKRILIANQVSGAGNLRSLAAGMNDVPNAEFYCLVDSVPGVRHLAVELERSGARRQLNVLVEWGRTGWRTGVRSDADGLQVFEEAKKFPRFLKVAGFEAFEGLASATEASDEAKEVDTLFDGLMTMSARLRSAWSGPDLPVLSIGGSAFLDRVLDLSQGEGAGYRIVLRSGCYVTHDHGTYRRKHEAALARGGPSNLPEFTPALELWSYVQSMPDVGRAFLTFGKRDCAYDVDLPVPLFSLAEGADLGSARMIAGAQVDKLNDQHAYLSLSGDEKLSIGDLVCCGISHPCTAFDKWRVIPVVDDDYNILDLYETFF